MQTTMQGLTASHSDEAPRLPPPKKVVYVPGTDFNLYMKQLTEANEQYMELYRRHKMYAFTRMTRGLVLDFIPPGMDLFHSMYVTRVRNYSLAGLSERMAQYEFRGAGTYLSPMFFDMDLETDKVVTLPMVQDLIDKVLFPCASRFFNLDQGGSSPALHLAVYSPMEKDESNQMVLQPSVKTTMVCGWCRNKSLKMTMCGDMPVAECYDCAMCFPRSIETNEVGHMPVLVSVTQLLAKYNAGHARKERFIRPPPPWVSIDDPEIDYNKEEHTIGFSVNTKRLEVKVNASRRHVAKVKRKYSIHIKALQTTHAEIDKQAQHNNIAARRYQAFRTKFHEAPDERKTIHAFVQYEVRKRKYLNQQQGRYEGDRVTRAYAEKQTEQVFGFPVYKMHEADKAMCRHLLHEKVIANVIMTQEIFLNFMAYLITLTTTYQSDLSDMHPFKGVDIQEMFDPQPAINGAALRVCFGKLNEPKPIKCKCENIAKTSRKRNAKGHLMASRECNECNGKGYYMDTSRNPTQLARILVDPNHHNYTMLQTAMNRILPRLVLTHNLPILLASTSTRVTLSGLPGIGTHDNTCRGVFADITSSVDNCMRNVSPNIIYQKKSTQPTGPRIVDGHVLGVVQSYIRSTDVRQWKDLSVQALVPWNDDKFPRYRVNVHSTASGAHFCCYKNDDHGSNTIYFVLTPPRSNGGLAQMYAACWSSGCNGCWRKTAMRDKTSWAITKQDAAIIWRGLGNSTQVRMPRLADAANSAHILYQPDESSEGLDSDMPTTNTLSFREVLQSKTKFRSLVASFGYFRLKRDESDAQPILDEACRALNLIGM